MIFIDELDVYLRSFYYWINFDLYSEHFNLSEELEAWRQFIYENESFIIEIEQLADEFGFRHDRGDARGMAGQKELITKRMNFFLPFDGLKIYPRLLYSEGYLPKLADFDKHMYFFMYSPKLLMPTFIRKEDTSWEVRLNTHRTRGLHRYNKKTNEHQIAYNVSVSVTLGTIIEEELHALGKKVHSTTNRKDILKAIKDRDPNLQKEIELNLKHILSAEEKRFREFGDLIQDNHSPEIRKLETFCNLFEKTLIEKKPSKV